MAGQKSGAEVGMQAGAAFGPWGAVIGAGVGAASDLIGKEMGGPVQSNAQVDARSWMDGSGWTVSTGSSTASGGRWGNNSQEAQQQRNPATNNTAPPAFGGYAPAFDGPSVADYMGAGSVGGVPIIGLVLVGAAFLLARK